MSIDLSQPAPRARPLEEAQAFIDELWLVLRAQAQQIDDQNQRIQTLEERLRTNPRNSSTPPSAYPHRPSTGKSPSGKKHGAQPVHSGKARTLLSPDQITHTHDCVPGPCPTCGGAVRITALCARHQVVVLPPTLPVVTEYRLLSGACCRCGQVYEAGLPPGVSRRVTGPRLQATVGTFTGSYHLSRRQVQGVLADLFGIELSVGAISEGEAEIGAALQGIVQRAHVHVQQAGVVHADETGHKERGCRHWLRLVVAGTVAVFQATATRSAQAARAALGERFAGILVSDRYGAYAWVESARRQLCWTPLLRDFTRIAERGGEPGRVGDELVACTQRMFRFWHWARDGTLSHSMFTCHMRLLRYRTETLLQQGAQGRHAETARTYRHILRLRPALLTFVDAPGRRTHEQLGRTHFAQLRDLQEDQLRDSIGAWFTLCQAHHDRRRQLQTARAQSALLPHTGHSGTLGKWRCSFLNPRQHRRRVNGYTKRGPIMRQSIIFFVSETAGVRQMFHQAYVELVRGERSVPEYAGQTVRVADWYVETCDGGPSKVDNETYSIFEFDREGHINWPKCRHGIAANHAFYAAVMASREMDNDEDTTIQQLRAEVGEDFTWFPNKQERASMEALAFGPSRG